MIKIIKRKIIKLLDNNIIANIVRLFMLLIPILLLIIANILASYIK